MKDIISLKHWKGILFAITFCSSLILSRQFTDPFFVPKNFFFFFSSSIFLLFICFGLYKKKYKQEVIFSYTDGGIVAFTIYSSIMAFFTPGIGLDNVKFYIFFINTLMFFAIQPYLFQSNSQKGSGAITSIVNIILVIGIVQVIWGILQLLNFTENLQKEFTIGAAFGNPGQYTNFLILVFAFAAALVLFSKVKAVRMLAIITSLGILVILPFTQARASWVAGLAVIVYLIDAKYGFARKMKQKISPVLRVGALVLVFLVAGLASVWLYNLKKDSSSGRLFIWKTSWEMIKDKPIFGFGFDRYASAHNDYQAAYFMAHPDDKESAAVADGVNYAFNEFVQVTVEVGVIGLLLFVALFVIGLRVKFSAAYDKGAYYPYFLAAKGLLIAFIILSLFSYPVHTVATYSLLVFALAILARLGDNKLFAFKMSPSQFKFLAVLGIVSFSIFMLLQYNRKQAEHKWLEAFKLMRMNKYNEAYRMYQEIDGKLDYNQFFIFNYGAELTLMKRYEESINELKKVECRLNDSDFYTYLANGYENMGDFKKAEECYQKSAAIMPLKFFPKYRLVQLYLQTGRKEEALKLATIILNMPVKVPSQIVDSIIAEMRQLVENSK